MADTIKAIRQNMDQKASDKLRCCQMHNLLAVAVLDAVVLPFECHGLGISADQSAVGNGNTVRVAG